MSRTNRPAKGMTLIEVMVSMSILLIGLLGMMRLQIWGLYSNQGARAHTIATQLARDLAGALDRLPFDDPHLAPTPAFGSLLQSDGTVAASGYTPFAPVPGVPGDDTIATDASGIVYQRRWTVRPIDAAGKASKVVAISVVYRERGTPRPREVLMYISKNSGANVLTNIGAFN